MFAPQGDSEQAAAFAAAAGGRWVELAGADSAPALLRELLGRIRLIGRSALACCGPALTRARAGVGAAGLGLAAGGVQVWWGAGLAGEGVRAAVIDKAWRSAVDATRCPGSVSGRCRVSVGGGGW
jgi:hypothetical protein